MTTEPARRDAEEALPTRASRRAARTVRVDAVGATPGPAPRADRATATLAVLVGVLLAAAGVVADRAPTAAVVALLVVAVANGWPGLLRLPSALGARTVLLLSSAALLAAVLVRRDEPLLEHVPVALALSTVGICLQQLVRSDGRTALTHSLAVSAAAVAVFLCGVCLVPLAALYLEARPVALVGAALAAGALADLLPLRRWAIPLAMLLGAGAAVVADLLVGRGDPGASALIGVVVAMVAASVRHVLAGSVRVRGWADRLTVAAAGALVPGVAVYAISRAVLG